MANEHRHTGKVKHVKSRGKMTRTFAQIMKLINIDADHRENFTLNLI